MGPGYLIDTNVIIGFSEGLLQGAGASFVASLIDNVPSFSVINKIELLGFSFVTPDIIDLLSHSVIIGLTDAVIAQTIALRKEKKIKLPDAIIAATSIVHGLTLVTRNTADFANIKGLNVLDPWTIPAG